MGGRARRGALIQELTRVNPWWTAPDWEARDPQLRAAAAAPFQRTPAVLDDIRPPNVYTLRGPRRTGKSTVLKQTIARLCSQGLDPHRIVYFAGDALSTFTDLTNLFQAARQLFPDLGDAPRYFLIDEVTAIPDWQRSLKWLRDNTLVAGDCVVATGSSARDIDRGAGYLAGRRGPDIQLDRLLLPMSFAEFTRCAGYPVPEPPHLALSTFYADAGRAACQEALVYAGVLADAFEAYLVVGGFPQAVADFRLRGQVSDGLVRDLWEVVRTDLRTLSVSRPEQALKLLERVAASLTGMVALRDLADDLDTSHQTAGSWLDALASAYLLLLLFQEAAGAPALRKQRKVYPTDPLIARLPARIMEGVVEPETSRLAEAAIAMALYRSVQGQAVDRFGGPAHLFYFRGRKGSEVDFIVPPEPWPVESKYIDAVTQFDSRAMTANFGGGLLVTRSAVDIKPGVTVLPASIFLWLLDQRG